MHSHHDQFLKHFILQAPNKRAPNDEKTLIQHTQHPIRRALPPHQHKPAQQMPQKKAWCTSLEVKNKGNPLTIS
jgi:hypothetical protein